MCACECVCVTAAFVLQIPPRWEMLIIGEISWTAVRFMPANNWKVCFHRFPFVNIKTRPGEKWCMLLHFRNLATRGKTLSSPSCRTKGGRRIELRCSEFCVPGTWRASWKHIVSKSFVGEYRGWKRMGRFDPRPGVPSSPSARRLTARPYSLSDRHTYKRQWMKFAYL